MIKYHDISAYSDDGEQLIIPAKDVLTSRNKTASGYSQVIKDFLSTMHRREDRYYVVINALGSYERWGCNSNGDAFPREPLSRHVDTFTGKPLADYGYKSFEHYAKYFRHHNNKSTSPSYGEVLFSYWNPILERVELVVAIDLFKESKYIKLLESGENVAVSMGCRVPYDVCNICGHKAKTRDDYCIHAKKYLRRIIGPETAAKWSKELGKTILPGTQVCVLNTMPIFFDISRVHVGADKSAFILGKAASETFFLSGVDLAESYDVEDSDFDYVMNKVASSKVAKNKNAAMNKTIPATDVDGVGMVVDNKFIPEKEKVLKAGVENTIAQEPEIPNHVIDNLANNFHINDILSSMLSLGIHPKPTEFQRIIIVGNGQSELADRLENNGMIFPQCEYDPMFDSRHTISPLRFNPNIQNRLAMFASARSAYPDLLIPRLTGSMNIVKVANASDNVKINTMLEDIGKMFASMKHKAKNLKASDDKFIPLKMILGGLIGSKLFGQEISNNDVLKDIPAEQYQYILKGDRFSDVKLAEAIAAPMIYKCASYDQDPLYKGHQLKEKRIYTSELEKVTFLW